MFLDEVELHLSGGKGGAGSNSLRREKYVPRGGPDGGDGGRGGDVVLVADPGEASLQRFQTERRFRAAAGGPGGPSRRHGADGEAIRLPVPAGTMVFDSGTGRLLADLVSPGAALVVAAGGRGGWGNTHFATPVAQTPRHRELGGPGTVATVRLELRLIADLGLVGLPNAGKSSLLARLTGARPKVADYPFTTLAPNLGVAELDGGRTITVADVPGLIEGAHLGAGLGIGFLRHLQRTRSLVQVVDASSGPEDAVRAYSEVHLELRAWDEDLAARPRVVAANKVDLVAGRARARVLKALREAVESGSQVLAVSALTGEGVEALLQESFGLARSREPVDAGGFRLYPGPRPARPEVFVEGAAGHYRVSGEGVLRLVAAADLDDPEEVTRLQRQLRRLGVESQLAASGATEGDVVEIGEVEFTFVPEGPKR